MRELLTIVLITLLSVNGIFAQTDLEGLLKNSRRGGNLEDVIVKIKVDTQQIENLPIGKKIITELKKSPYVSQEPIIGNDWHLRFFYSDSDKDTGRVPRIWIERQGMPNKPVLRTDIDDPELFKKINELAAKASLWNSFLVLKNPAQDANFGIRVRFFEVKGKFDENGAFSEESESEINNFDSRTIGDGTVYYLQVENKTNEPLYFNVLNLSSDLAINNMEEDSQEVLLPGKTLKTRLFQVVPPLGLEYFKVIASRKPIENRFDLLKELASASSDEWFQSTVSFTSAPPPTLHLFSVDTVLSDQNESKKEKQTVLDGIEKAWLLQNPTGKVNREILFGKQSTSKNILTALEKTAQISKEEDSFVFYFKGGLNTTDENSSVEIVTAKSNEKENDSKISDVVLKPILDKIAARQKLLVFDSDSPVSALQLLSSRLSDENDKINRLLNKQTIIWSIANNGEIFKTDSAFTNALQSALKGEADLGNPGDGLLSTLELESYLQRKVLELSQGKTRFFAPVKSDSFVIGAVPLKAGDDSTPKPKPQEIRGSVSVDTAAPETAKIGKRYALLFGTNKYDAEDMWSELKNPIRDVEALGKVLQEDYGFEVEIVRDANLDGMVSALEKYTKKKYAPNDQLIIFFAGHGKYKDKPTDLGFVVAKDSQSNDFLSKTYLSYADLANVVNAIECRHILLLLDVCYGGTFGQVAIRGENSEYNKIADQKYVSKILQKKTRKFITSGGKEYVTDGQGNHSPFAYKMIDILSRNAATSNIITFDEILAGLRRIDVRQTPVGGDFRDNEPGSDFIFVPKQN